MMGRKKKSKRVILYKKFLADQEKVKELERKSVEFMEAKEDKCRNKKMIIPYSIAICSLQHGSGCSYFTYALAKYLEENKKSVYVITESNSILESDLAAGKQYVGGTYDHIIYDFGSLIEMKQDELTKIQFCQGKILMCQFTTEYLKDIYQFINVKLRETKTWAFLFSFVPSKDDKKVSACMEDYNFEIIPIFSKNDYYGTLEKILQVIWV